MLSQAQADEYLLELEAVSAWAQGDLEALWGTYDLSDPSLAYGQALADVEALVAVYGDFAAELAAELYELLRQEAYPDEGFTATLPDHSQEALRHSVGSQLSPLYSGDYEAAFSNIAALLDRYVLNQARDTVRLNASLEKDTRRARFARVPAGLATCAYCAMLASRGFIYSSEETAGAGSHDHCRCMVVPGFGDDPSWPGYKPESYYRMYDESGAGSHGSGTETLAGVSRGGPMGFEEANRGNVNPLYGPKEYRINCQKCVVAYEARLRGYDVTAAAGEGLHAWKNVWIDRNTQSTAEYTRITAPNLKSLKNSIDEATVEAGRYHIAWTWKGKSNVGHITSLERLGDGSLFWYEPQIGKVYTDSDVAELQKEIKLKGTTYGVKYQVPVYIIRVDDKEFDYSVANGMLEKI